MILDVDQDDNHVVVSYYDSEGSTQIKKYPLSEKDLYKWTTCSENDRKKDPVFRNWDNKPVKKVAAKYLNKFRLIEFINGLSETDKQVILEYNLPNPFFIDIEVEVSDEFPDPKFAKNQITTICVVTPKNQCIVLGTKDLSKNQIQEIDRKINEYFKSQNQSYNFNYLKFKTEYDLLYTFLNKFVRKMPMMSGWNVIKFDWAYIYNRAKKLGIDVSIASPVDKVSYNTFPKHVGIMDYLDIYSKWDKSVLIKEDMKLDTAGKDVLGISKIKYNGGLQDLYEQDYPKYVYYNAVDTVLVQLIHRKIKTLDIALTISFMSNVSVFKAASPVSVTESLLCHEYLKENKVIASSTNVPEKVPFEGAFVKEPRVGMHKNVACFDFASLYPSVMRQLNISPETFVKKVDLKYIESNKTKDTIISANGVIYDNTESSLKRILDELYGKRREYKKKFMEFKQKYHDLKNS